MKKETFESMKRALEVLQAYGQKTFSTGKKVMRLQEAIRKIEAIDDKKIVDETLSHFRTNFSTLPKSIRGEAKKRFCAACYDSIIRKGKYYFINAADGSIKVNSVLTTIRKTDDEDLSIIIANFVDDDFSKYEAQKTEAEAKAETEAEAKAKNAIIEISDLEPEVAEAVAWMDAFAA